MEILHENVYIKLYKFLKDIPNKGYIRIDFDNNALKLFLTNLYELNLMTINKIKSQKTKIKCSELYFNTEMNSYSLCQTLKALKQIRENIIYSSDSIYITQRLKTSLTYLDILIIDLTNVILGGIDEYRNAKI